VYSIGFAGNSPRANATYGYVKGLYPLDDSVVVRASNPFRLGDSGGGVFDEDGNLVAIIAVKSPGHHAYYYNMSVEWVKKLMTAAEQSVVAKSELPFWAEAPDKWPYFMKIVHPLKTEDWTRLSEVAAEWVEKEPNNLEATFYQAVAEYGLKKTDYAELRLKQVVSLNQQHSGAMYYLGLIAEESGKHAEALEMVAMLDHLQDRTAVIDLKVAMGMPE
jgi:serine protease Do